MYRKFLNSICRILVVLLLSGSAYGECLQNILDFVAQPSIWNDTQARHIQAEIGLGVSEFFILGKDQIDAYPGSDLTFLTSEERASLLSFVRSMIAHANKNYGGGGEFKLEHGEIRSGGAGFLVNQDSEGFHNHLGFGQSRKNLTVTKEVIGGSTIFRGVTCPENAASMFSDDIDHCPGHRKPGEVRMVVILSLKRE
jgi:hypothetical protein